MLGQSVLSPGFPGGVDAEQVEETLAWLTISAATSCLHPVVTGHKGL